jgi:hypothetical protein
MPFPPPKTSQPASERAPFREPDASQLSPAMQRQKARADALRRRRPTKQPPPDPSALGSG